MILLSSKGIYDGLQIRKHVFPKKLNTYLSSNLPHHIISRIVVMQSGSDIYNMEIINRAQRSNNLKDNALNRILYSNLLYALTDEQLTSHIFSYPFDDEVRLLPLYDRLTSHLLNKLETEGLDFKSKYLLQKLLSKQMDSSSADNLFEDLVISNLEKKYLPVLFNIVIGDLCKRDHPKWKALTRKYLYSKMNAGMKMEAYEIISKLALPNNKNFIFLNRISIEMNFSPNQKLVFLSRLIMERQNDNEIFNEFKKNLALVPSQRGTYKWELGDSGLAYSLAKHFKGNRELFIEKVIHLSKNINVELAASAFHWMVDNHPSNAIKIYEDIVQKKDSSLRKSMVVLLARHGLNIPTGSIDWAFVGIEPRETYFGNYEYVYGSSATTLYEKLSGHDYLGHGKILPLKITASKGEWMSFISGYPWHPGTDDAYLHLLNVLFYENNFQEFWRVVDHYFNLTLPDTDSNEYISFLVREALLTDPKLSQRSHFHKAAGHLLKNPVGKLVYSKPSRELIDALVWISKHKEKLEIIDVSIDFVNIYIKIINGRSKTITDGKLSFLKQFHAYSFYNIFYGINTPEGIDLSQTEIYRQAKIISKKSIQQWNIEWKNADFSQRSIYAPLVSWVINHGESDELALYFQPLLSDHFDLLSHINVNKISDWGVRRRVRNILEANSK